VVSSDFGAMTTIIGLNLNLGGWLPGTVRKPSLFAYFSQTSHFYLLNCVLATGRMRE